MPERVGRDRLEVVNREGRVTEGETRDRYGLTEDKERVPYRNGKDDVPVEEKQEVICNKGETDTWERG